MALVVIVLAGLVCGAVITFVVLAVIAAAQTMNDTEVWFGLDDWDTKPATESTPDTWRRRRDLEAEAADQRERHQLEADEAPKPTNPPNTGDPE